MVSPPPTFPSSFLSPFWSRSMPFLTPYKANILLRNNKEIKCNVIQLKQAIKAMRKQPNKKMGQRKRTGKDIGVETDPFAHTKIP